MLFFSIGLHSRFGEWCDATVAQLVQSLGPAAVVGANTMDDLAAAVITSDVPYLVAVSRLIGRLQGPLARTNRPFVVALDEPRRALWNLVANHGVGFVEATRLVGISCASMLSCAAMPNALVLHGDAQAPEAAAAMAIARHFSIPVTEAQVDGIVGGLAEQGISPHPTAHETWWESLDDAQRSLAVGALDPYGVRFRGGELGPITWERDLFFINEPPNEQLAASRPVDVTGVPRFVIYGPYITLPPGSWSATVALGFSKEASEISYVVDLIAATQLGSVRVQPGNDRSVEIDMHFSIDEPLDEPLVVRVFNERAAFDGRVALGYVTLSPRAHLRPETQNYFTSALAR